MKQVKVLLKEKDIPKRWYNLQADLPYPLHPPLHPKTNKPLTAKELLPIFPQSLIEQELSLRKWISIPEPIRDIYRLWRPTPLRRAYNLEKYLKTKARIYYKDESVSPTGSHKANTAIAQAYYNKQEGVKCITTETGAGQWGSALSFACNSFSLKCKVYMVKVSFKQKPFRKSMMKIWGSEVIPSPSRYTSSGRSILRAHPKTSGSLGMAISEAVEDAIADKKTKYSLGSVLNHVLLHQTVIGLETKKQLKKIKVRPDYLVGCVGGGSNFAGFAFPFIKEKLGGEKIDIVAVEPTACPTLTKGAFNYDYGDNARLTPLLKMFTLGHDFVPPPVHSGGLRYHGCAPLVSLLADKKIIKPVAYHQLEIFKTAILFAKLEGIVPAPETAHALHAAVKIAQKTKKKANIVINFSGHGYFDLLSYDKYLDKQLSNYAYPHSEIKKSLEKIKGLGE
jgi:tryptophan synthase beta chain